MLTRCPKCETLYRLTNDQIEAAGGKVRCSRCYSVFNAIEHIQQTEPRETSSSQPETDGSVIAQPKPDRIGQQPAEKAKTPDILLQPVRKEPGAAWWFAALLLTAIAAVQLAWLDRASLIKDPQGKSFLTTLCGIVGCTLPQPRDPDKFRVLSRDMSSHPDKKNALLFTLVMANKADFAQPYPYLQLDLFDNDRKPAGQRTFSPQEYLDPKPSEDLLQPDETVYIKLELLDPGPDISGFEIKFL
jgi:predicted Zn finger-like uncharacterized protein